jgi:hypothetical protein
VCPVWYKPNYIYYSETIQSLIPRFAKSMLIAFTDQNVTDINLLPSVNGEFFEL